MRYQSSKELPPTIADVLTEEAQEVYIKAYNDGWDAIAASEGDLSRHGVAHRQGWAAVEREFVQDPDTGRWKRAGEAAKEEEKGLLGKVKDVIDGIVS